MMNREVRRSLFMARLHLEPMSADEVTEFVAFHLGEIEKALATNFEGQIEDPKLSPDVRIVPGVLRGRSYEVYAKLVDNVVELRRIEF